MRITEAAQRLGTSPRMLRYRDLLGLLPPVRTDRRATSFAPGRPAPAYRPAPARTGPSPASPGHPAAHDPVPGRGTRTPHSPARHRRFSDDDLAAVALALRIEQRYDISPAALAFGLRVLTESGVRADVAELGRRIGRIGPPPARALEFEKERALRLLRLAPGGQPPPPRPRPV